MPSEKPILFNADMVRAILDGRKTQTRRLVKPQPHGEVPSSILTGWYEPIRVGRDGIEFPGPSVYGFASEYQGWRSPFGAPGDRLWVREPARLVESNRHIHQACGGDVVRVEYRADGLISDWLPYPERLATLQMGRGLPNGCYREASRLTLEITDVRVERLQDISEEDADAEVFGGDFPHKVMPDMFDPENDWKLSIPECFARLWDCINGTKSAANWNANPFVWVVSFRRIAK